MNTKKKFVTIDGNTAAAYIGYLLSDLSFIYPITPSTPMGEFCEKQASKKIENIFGNVVNVTQMQSEAGVAGAIHGAALSGTLVSTYTSSQGLLLMIPNMYKIAGECLPVVFHVAARSIAAQSLCIFGDHQDVMACRQTGFCILASNNPQEVMDFALIAHIAAIKSSLPFLHFFDGFRTSHEVNKIEQISKETINAMFPYDDLLTFKQKAHNPFKPKLTGSAQNDDTYFQSREANNILYDKVYDHVQTTMNLLAKYTGRVYKPYEYYGCPNATDIIIAMGSGVDCIQETLDLLIKKKQKKYGVLKVHLFRPFVGQEFVKALPKTVKRICVLDRTKEPGSIGEPLYEDVVLALKLMKKTKIKVIGGRFGLGSKNFTPDDVIAIYQNLKNQNGLTRFTVGFNDDVTNLSLKSKKSNLIINPHCQEFKFWGFGSDGTVSASKSTIKIIGQNTNKYVQGYFEYDSNKSGGLTISHLRIANQPIKSSYYLQHPNFIGIHHFSYVNKYDVLQGLTKKGIVLLNSTYSIEKIDKYLPNSFKEKIKKMQAKLYIIDANKIASKANLGNKINIIMQSCFFKITNIISYDLAQKLIKDFIIKTFANKSELMVKNNLLALTLVDKNLQEVDVNKLSKSKTESIFEASNTSKYYQNFCQFITQHKGYELPTSSFNYDGSIPTATSKYEKRMIGNMLPIWQPSSCVQCGLCVLSCPHACLQSGIIKKNDLLNKPDSFLTKSAIGVKDSEFVVQVSPKDCTSCGLCVKTCPIKGLTLTPIEQVIDWQEKNFNFFQQIKKNESLPFKQKSIKGLQFSHSYFEFPKACPGCGQTPYLKAICQLFGPKMIIANATGCSSIWGGGFPTTPFTIDENGFGPSWANSLFEDNAEFGLGIALANKQKQKDIFEKLKTIFALPYLSSQTKKVINDVLNNLNHPNLLDLIKKMINQLKIQKWVKQDNLLVQQIIIFAHQLINKSIWIIGGDGWAYDIGFGGLDHIFSSKQNVNILVLDNECYANTGGQVSKATPIGVVTKFASNGKITNKKDLATIALTYKDVFVCQVAIGANPQQFIDAVTQAEAYNGVSLIIAYAPCISHGINMSNSWLEQKKAVECGYWPLFKYNPSLNPKFVFQSPNMNGKYQEFLKEEIRFKQLMKIDLDKAQELYNANELNAKDKIEKLQKLNNE